MLNAADLTHNSGMEEWDNEVDITCCTFGAPAAGNKGKKSLYFFTGFTQILETSSSKEFSL